MLKRRRGPGLFCPAKKCKRTTPFTSETGLKNHQNSCQAYAQELMERHARHEQAIRTKQMREIEEEKERQRAHADLLNGTFEAGGFGYDYDNELPLPNDVRQCSQLQLSKQNKKNIYLAQLCRTRDIYQSTV